MREVALRLKESWATAPIALLLGGTLGLALLRLPLRDLLAGVLVLAAALAVFRWPSLTMGSALVWLTLQGLVRRLLIPVVGWSSNDPLLLIVPVVVVLACLQHRAFRRPWNALTRMMVVVCGIIAVETVSPAGAGLRANLVGAMFVLVPALWFFIGRSVHPKLARTVVAALPWAALPVLGYGLWQLFIGLPPWDLAWVKAVGYSALDLAGHTRPFGTFASSAEDEIFLLCASVAGFGIAFRSRGLRVPLYLALGLASFVGAFLDGARTGIVLSVGGIGILWAYRRRQHRLWRLAVVGAGVVVGYLALIHGHHFQAPSGVAANSTTNAVFQHQMQGLTHPLNKRDSTLSLHLRMIRASFVAGFRHPLGQGVGMITLAGARFGAAAANSEVDLTNMFIAGGVLGGFAYLTAWLMVLIGAMRMPANATLERYVLPAILLAAFGQWLNGGYYLVSALVWLIIGSTLGRPTTDAVKAGAGGAAGPTAKG